MRHSILFKLAIRLVAGEVLHVSDITVGNGLLIDWRTEKSGETLLEGADAFDLGLRLLHLLGEDTVCDHLALDDTEVRSPARPPARVHAYAPYHDGSRRRSFEAGPFRVMIEPYEDDAAQAAFAVRLAEAATSLLEEG